MVNAFKLALATGCLLLVVSGVTAVPNSRSMRHPASLSNEEVLAEEPRQRDANWRGFVADRSCAECHPSISESFKTHGMGNSFARPQNARVVEDFTARGVRDGRLTYRLSRQDERLIYSQWQTGPDGEPIHRFEREVDWVIGSGSASRVYFVQSAEGALFELPIAWYTQESSWGIKPGAERDAGEAGLRLVHRGCMFCHNAVPTSSGFQDERFATPTFPTELPEGIGCQRCHGPGLDHVEKTREVEALRSAGATKPLTLDQRRALRDAIRATIINPKNLPPARRRDVCAQCHHQPSVSVFGQRRIGRGDFGFQAGQDLQEFLVKLEVLERDREGQLHGPEQRFEINHHGYRLEGSSCFLESPAGHLECTTCHDPHRKGAKAETLDRARSACLSCHADSEATQTPARVAGQPRERHLARQECVSCHMPRRRTQDVVHVVMTDHRIQARPDPSDERLAALPDRTTFPIEVKPLESRSAGTSSRKEQLLDELALGSGSIRMGFFEPAARLSEAISQASMHLPGVDLSEPRLRLAQAHLRTGDLEEARRLLESIMAEESSLEANTAQQARIWLSIVAARQNQPERALALVNQAIEKQGSRRAASASAWLFSQRGRLRLWSRRAEEACTDFERAVELNEFLARTWTQVGRCRIQKQDYPGAAEALSRALGLDPSQEGAASPLVAVLAALGRDEEARRVMRHHGLE